MVDRWLGSSCSRFWSEKDYGVCGGSVIVIDLLGCAEESGLDLRVYGRFACKEKAASSAYGTFSSFLVA